MKFFAVVVAFAASAIAQRVSIGAPSAGTSVAPGEYINVEVDKPVSTTHNY